MATFTNSATLTYDGNTVNSNTVTGELLEQVSGSKTAITDSYTPGDEITYVISLVNSTDSPLSPLAIQDNLGAYTVGSLTLYPLSYIPGSLRYYVGGVLQPTPSVDNGPPLVISGIGIPADSNVTLIYAARVNEFAPPTAEGQITNVATVSGDCSFFPITLSESVTTDAAPQLTVSKSLCPAVVEDNGTLTYTFVIQNTGSAPATAADALVLTDLFNPALQNIGVTYNGQPWVSPTNYTYNSSTGAFSTVEGQLTVPAATFQQNPDGSWTVTPGTGTLVITGTV